MLFIGGIDSKQAEVGQFDAVECPHCGEKHAMTLYKNYYFFHFFFLPLFKWSVKYLVTCHGCHAILALSEDKGKALEKGTVHDIAPADLAVVEEGTAKASLCLNCHREVDPHFTYCPHCGEKRN